MREGLDSTDIDSPRRRRASRAGACARWRRRRSRPRVPDLEFAHTVLVVGCEPLDDAPILDLRIRKGVRRHGVKLAIASARPSALDPNAALIARYAPGGEARFLAELERRAGRRRTPTDAELGELAGLLRDGGEDVVIVWGERIGADAAAVAAADRRARSGSATAPAPGCSRSPPAPTAAGCARRASSPTPARATPRSPAQPGRGAAEIARARRRRRAHRAVPVPDRPGARPARPRRCGSARCTSAALVVAHASVLTEGLREHANVIFPAESHAEKEGTVVHPDGRLQRLRIGDRPPRRGPPGWAVLAELARRAGADFGRRAQRRWRSSSWWHAVPFYAGLTLEEIGGHGVRWPERPQAAATPPARG